MLGIMNKLSECSFGWRRIVKKHLENRRTSIGVWQRRCFLIYQVSGIKKLKITQFQNAKASTTHGKEMILRYFAVVYMF
jgi:hypothetical protein